MQQEERKRETRIRYIHHKDTEDVSIQHIGITKEQKKITLTSSTEDTVVMEKVEDDVIHCLRFLNLNFKRITPIFFNEFVTVTRLELGCPVPILWIFKYLPYLEKLKSVRFGQQALGCEKESACEKVEGGIRVNEEVRSLELSYDVPRYNDLDHLKQQIIDEKIKCVMLYGTTYFPSLCECSLTIPKKIEQHLEHFLEHFPDIRASGEKRAKYAEGYAIFCNQKNLKRQSSATTETSSHRSAKRHNEDVPKSSRPAKDPRENRRSASKRLIISKREVIEDDDDDVVCLEDGPSSSGIPPDYPSLLNHSVGTSDSGRTRRTSPSLFSKANGSY